VFRPSHGTHQEACRTLGHFPWCRRIRFSFSILRVNQVNPIQPILLHTPSHKVIHEHGITPDILVPMTDDEERDVFLKRTPGGVESLEEKDRERVRKSRDTQLDRAMAESIIFNNSISIKENADAMAAIRASGKAQFFDPTPEQLQVWKDAFMPIYKSAVARIGKAMIDEALVATGRTPTN
jgi:hypothetical protein